MKYCENCNNEIIENYGSGRFCSSKCAKSFSTKEKRSYINSIVSKKLFGRESLIKGRTSWKKGAKLVEYKNINCLQCNKIFEIRADSNRKFCGKSCASKYLVQSRLLNNTHNGYPSRKNKIPSFAEKIVISILEYNNIEYIRDKKINRFFGDFVFESKKVVLEIDGKQHKQRIEYDKKRDLIINNEGYSVIRIPWIHNDLEKIKNDVENFLKIYITRGD